MAKKRNQHTIEYKVEAAFSIIEKGKSIAEVARELGTAQS
jgi:transposase-like protein